MPAAHLPTSAAPVLVVPLGGAHDVLSWAIVNGGRRRATAVVWRQVATGELGPDVDPAALMRRALIDVDLPEAVGLLTGRDVRSYEEVTAADGTLVVRCLATVGLANALAAGDPPGPAPAAGTINLLCQVSASLSEEALIEASSIATEARTAAVLEARIPSPLSGRMASGTGTDCTVIAAPATSPGPRLAYTGKHTVVGSLIGAAVRDAVARGIARCIEEHGWPKR
jgi:adenosylcobinamide amidohydrolase